MTLALTSHGDAESCADDEVRLLARVQAGDGAAFESLVLQHHARLRRFLANLVRDDELADDVLQETLLELHNALNGPTPPPSLTRWLYRVATNNALDAIRRRSVRTRVCARLAALAPRFHDPADDALGRMAATRALMRLSPMDRACVLLHAALGLRYHEVGQMLGLSDQAARQRITRAKARFRKHYEKEC